MNDALIHLRLPAATKARWVRESRAAGMRLTDWIIQRVETRTLKTYPIPDALADAYHGAGWALASILGDQVVALRYISDIAPAISDGMGSVHATFFIKQWMQTAEAASIVRELQALGEVSVGMCSAWEFVEQ